jgi:hypothetical protein
MSQDLARALTIALALTLTAPAAVLAGSEAGVEAASTTAVDAQPVTLAEDATLRAVLDTKLDARHAKVDDAIAAHTTQAVDAQADTALSLPRGTKLLGRVTQVAADGDSRVGVVFDRVVLPDGRELAAALEIQALAAAETTLDRPVRSPSVRTTARSGATSHSGLLGGAVGAAGNVVGGAAGAVGAGVDTAVRTTGSLDTRLSSSTVGVVALEGLRLEASGSNSTIVSTSGPVVLRSGTRILLRTRASAN